MAAATSTSDANYLAVRFHQSPARKGAAFSLVPDTSDAFVYQDEYINFLDKTYVGAFAAANNPIFISMDNEPDLWHTTHARLRGDAVRPPGTQSGHQRHLRRDRAAHARLRECREGRESRMSPSSAP